MAGRDKVSYWDSLIQKKQDRIRDYKKVKSETSDPVNKALQDRKIQEAQETIRDLEHSKAEGVF